MKNTLFISPQAIKHLKNLSVLILTTLLLTACGGGGGGSSGSSGGGGAADIDGDGIADAVDVDADGDGLIEISTAAELNMMRYNLGGTGLDADNSDNDNNTGGNSMGCGGGSYVNGTAITACNGYEQMADIDLNDLPKGATSNNWEPIGTCGSGIDCNGASGAQFFSGTFSGNNFIISNLFINVATERYGVGLFGAISPAAQVRNAHIRGGNITRTGVISTYVGGLVGRGRFATISNSSVTLAEISGTGSVGGLVGSVGGATVSSSSVTIDAISGSTSVGGLVGFCNGARISSSVATVGSISGTSSSVGGLAGSGGGAIVSSSVAIVGSVNGTSGVGGLVGSGGGEIISSSVATVGSISGTINVGGLIGVSHSAIINSSVAIANNIDGSNDVGGLLGFSSSTSVTVSYWDNKVSFVNATSNTFGSGQTTAVLTNQTSFTGTGNIYATWGDAYCNPNTGEYSATAPSPLGDYIRVWDLGTSSQYPAITCVQRLLPLDIQREAARRALAGELPLVD